MKKTIHIVTITFISFAVYFFLDEEFFRTVRTWIDGFIYQIGISHIIAYSIFGLPIFMGAVILHRKHFLQSLGLKGAFFKAFTFALICTLPMFIGFAFAFKFNTEISLTTILISIIAAAFFEELYFRGFIFGQVFRYSKLGFIPSVILGSLLFGIMHLYQSTDIVELLGIFLVTFLGGILFSWVYVEWNYNIWVPVFLHLLMNLSWELFSVSDNALGGIISNVCRIGTIILIIVLTILSKRKREQKFYINRSTVWLKKES